MAAASLSLERLTVHARVHAAHRLRGFRRALLLQFDHRLVTASADRAGSDVEAHDGEGIVLIEGKTPTVENVCRHVAAQVDALIRARFPGRGVHYGIEVAMREGGDAFSVSHDVII